MRRWRPLVAGLFAASVLFAGFWELAEDLAESAAVLRFDAVVSTAIQSLRSPAMTVIMKAITVMGGLPVVLVTTVVIVITLWTRGRRDAAIYSAVIVGGGALISTAMKNLLGRGRPPVDNALITLPDSFSFPSGHTMGSLCLAWVLGYVVLTSPTLPRQRRPWLLMLIALYPVLVGTSRVYLGVHWPSDVLASWLLGGAWIALVTGIHVTHKFVSDPVV